MLASGAPHLGKFRRPHLKFSVSALPYLFGGDGEDGESFAATGSVGALSSPKLPGVGAPHALGRFVAMLKPFAIAVGTGVTVALIYLIAAHWIGPVILATGG